MPFQDFCPGRDNVDEHLKNNFTHFQCIFVQLVVTNAHGKMVNNNNKSIYLVCVSVGLRGGLMTFQKPIYQLITNKKMQASMHANGSHFSHHVNKNVNKM